jgi:long-chain acyl-CoA synthetase
METLPDLLRTARDQHGEKTALAMRVGLREDRWSYRRLWDAADAVARYLREELRLRPGDRVVIWGPNCPRLVAAYFGAMLARLVLVPVDPYATPAFLARVAEKTDAAAVVCGFAAPDLAGRWVIALEELPSEGAAPFPEDGPAADDIAEIVFTSGTTGEPKGVILTHGNITANVESAARIIPADSRYRLLSLLPLSHMLEQTIGLYLPLRYGATVYYPSSRQAPVIFKALRRHRIVTMVLVPQVLSLMLQGIEREVRRRGKVRQWQAAHRLAPHLPLSLRRLLFRDVHRQLGGGLEFLISGGAHLPPELASAWERMGVKVAQGYGTTECAPVVAANSLEVRMPGSAGRPVAGVRVRLSPDDEIQVRGPNVTRGYWQDEEATRAAFTEDGWYRTGDIAERDRDGYLYLRGRLKERIVLASGLKVYPEDVEAVLKGEEGIADCVVVGREDAGSVRVHAVLIAAPGAGDEQAIRQRLDRAVRDANAHLAPNQRISGYTLWSEGDFPRTNLLKVKRHEVLATLAGETRPRPATVHLPAADGDVAGRIGHLLARAGGVEIERVTPESDLTLDLNLDSLARVELAVALEDELGVAVDDGALAAVNTVAQLTALVERSEKVAPPVSFPGWALSPVARGAREVVQALLLLPLHRLICRPFRVEGVEHLRELTLPALLIANHSSHLDTPSILRALPARLRRRTAVAAAADYFYRTRLAGFLTSLALNGFPLYREGAVRASLEYCGELADDGWSVLVYPEGTRSPAGRLQPFRSGSGLLATELRVPVVPIAVIGTYQILPKGRSLPRPGPVTVRIGAPLPPVACDDHARTAAHLEGVVARLLACR